MLLYRMSLILCFIYLIMYCMHFVGDLCFSKETYFVRQNGYGLRFKSR